MSCPAPPSLVAAALALVAAVKVARLGHVDPEAVKGDQGVEGLDLAAPVIENQSKVKLVF